MPRQQEHDLAHSGECDDWIGDEESGAHGEPTGLCAPRPRERGQTEQSQHAEQRLLFTMDGSGVAVEADRGKRGTPHDPSCGHVPHLVNERGQEPTHVAK